MTYKAWCCSALLLLGCSAEDPEPLAKSSHHCGHVISLQKGIDVNGAMIRDLVDCSAKMDAKGEPLAKGLVPLVYQLGASGIDHALDFLFQDSPNPQDKVAYPYLDMTNALLERGIYRPDGTALAGPTQEERLETLQNFLKTIDVYRLGSLLFGWEKQGHLDTVLQDAVKLLDALDDGSLSALTHEFFQNQAFREATHQILEKILADQSLYEAWANLFQMSPTQMPSDVQRQACSHSLETPSLLSPSAEPLPKACQEAQTSGDGRDAAQRMEDILSSKKHRDALTNTIYLLIATFINHDPDHQRYLNHRAGTALDLLSKQRQNPAHAMATLTQRVMALDDDSQRPATILEHPILADDGLVQSTLHIPENLDIVRQKSAFSRMSEHLAEALMSGDNKLKDCPHGPPLFEDLDPQKIMNRLEAQLRETCGDHPKIAALVLHELQDHCQTLGIEDCELPSLEGRFQSLQKPRLASTSGATENLVEMLLKDILATTGQRLRQDDLYLWQENLAATAVDAALFEDPDSILMTIVAVHKAEGPEGLAKIDQAIEAHHQLNQLFLPNLMESLLARQIVKLQAAAHGFRDLLPAVPQPSTPEELEQFKSWQSTDPESRVLNLMTGTYPAGPVEGWLRQTLSPSGPFAKTLGQQKHTPARHLRYLWSNFHDPFFTFKRGKVSILGGDHNVTFLESDGSLTPTLVGTKLFQPSRLFTGDFSAIDEILHDGAINLLAKDAYRGQEKEFANWMKATIHKAWFNPQSEHYLAVAMEAQVDPMDHRPLNPSYFVAKDGAYSLLERRMLSQFFVQNFSYAPLLVPEGEQITGEPLEFGPWPKPRGNRPPALKSVGTAELSRKIGAWATYIRLFPKALAPTCIKEECLTQPLEGLTKQLFASEEAFQREVEPPLLLPKEQDFPAIKDSIKLLLNLNLMTDARPRRQIQPILGYGEHFCQTDGQDGPCPFQLKTDFASYQQTVGHVPLALLCRAKELLGSLEPLGYHDEANACATQQKGVRNALHLEGAKTLPISLQKIILGDILSLGRNPVLRPELQNLVPLIRLEKLRLAGHLNQPSAQKRWLQSSFAYTQEIAHGTSKLMGQYRPFHRHSPAAMEQLLQHMLTLGSGTKLRDLILHYAETGPARGSEAPHATEELLQQLVRITQETIAENGSISLAVLKLLHHITQPGEDPLLDAAALTLTDFDGLVSGQILAYFSAIGMTFHWDDPGDQILKELMKMEHLRMVASSLQQFELAEIRSGLKMVARILAFFGSTPEAQEAALKPLAYELGQLLYGVDQAKEQSNLQGINQALSNLRRTTFSDQDWDHLQSLWTNVTNLRGTPWQDWNQKEAPPLITLSETPPQNGIIRFGVRNLHRMVKGYQTNQTPEQMEAAFYLRDTLWTSLQPLARDQAGLKALEGMLRDQRFGIVGPTSYLEALVRCDQGAACGRRYLLDLIQATGKAPLALYELALDDLEVLLPSLHHIFQIAHKLEFKPGHRGRQELKSHLDALRRISQPVDQNPMLLKQTDLLRTWLRPKIARYPEAFESKVSINQ